jgi:hypothetical protein
VFPEICGVKKWGKREEKGDEGYEASTYCMGREVGEKYQSKMRRPLEHVDAVACNVSDK